MPIPFFSLGFDDLPEDSEERVPANPEEAAIDWSSVLYDDILVYGLMTIPLP